MYFPLMKNIDPNVLKFSFGGQLSQLSSCLDQCDFLFTF
jgi:hypothetical protein